MNDTPEFVLTVASMHILLVSANFPPELGAGAARAYELAREWVRLGQAVTVVTDFPSHPQGIKAKSDRGLLWRHDRIDGIDVLRVWHYAAANRGRLRRMVSFFSFMLSAAVLGSWRCQRPDIVLATSPQLLAGVAGYMLARRFRVPFVFEVRDLWPESIMAVGVMRDNFIVRGLKHVSAFLYHHCAHLVTVGPGYAEQIQRHYGVSPHTITLVPNGVDLSLFTPQPRDNDTRRRLGWAPDERIVGYLGNHGLAQGLRTVLEAARELASVPRLRFIFVGDGADRDALMALAREWKLANVQFLEAQPKSDMPGLYAACDLGIVPLRGTPLFQSVLPSKLFEFFGMARPVVTTVDGDARRLVEAAGAGVFVPPDCASDLAAAIQRLLNDPVTLARMGRNGREYVVRHHDRQRLAATYLELLAAIRGRRPSPTR